MNTLILLLVLAASGPRSQGEVLEETIEVRGLSAARAASLAGRPRLFRVAVESSEGLVDGLSAYDCVSDVGNDVVLVLPAGTSVESGEAVVVGAVLRETFFPADGPFPAFTQFRLYARRVR